MIPENGYTVVVLANYDPPAADGMAREIADFLIKQSWAAPYSFAIPDGWRAEGVALPPPFAPRFGLKGMDDLRFPRGWRDPTSDEYWSFAYLLWLDGGQKIDIPILQDNLKIYYEGLIANAVARDHISADKLVPVQVKFKKTDTERDDRETYTGTIDMLDYMAQKPMTLNCMVHVKTSCVAQDHIPIFFELSPKGFDHPIWEGLRYMNDKFGCGE